MSRASALRGAQRREGRGAAACRLAALVIAILAIDLAAPPAAAEGQVRAPEHGSAPSSVDMHVSVGYNGYYRGNPTWTPVRATLGNRTDATVSGTLEVPDTTLWYPSQIPQAMRALYDAEVVLPPYSRKQVTLYLPGADIRGEVSVSFRDGDRALAEASEHPTMWPDDVITVGVLTSDAAETAWLQRRLNVGRRQRGVDLIELNPASIDPVPEALASFDLIAITNVDASSLDEDQRSALTQYVRNGGALLLIGGPDWQETLQSLPAALVPGHLSGSRPVSGLSGLQSLGEGIPPADPTTISLLSRPRGSVLVAQAGVPLVVRMGLGNGQVEYLAFDPATSPLMRRSRAASGILTYLEAGAAPLAIRRLSLPSPYWSPWFLNPSNWSSWFLDSEGQPLDAVAELSNTRIASAPLILPLAIAALLYAALTRRVHVFVKLRLHRSNVGGLMTAALTLLLLAPFCLLALHFKGRTALVSTVNAVVVGDGGPRQPATMYVGLFAPLPGDYHLHYAVPALPFSNMPPSPSSVAGPLGAPTSGGPSWRFQEGAGTDVDLLSMGLWSTRALALRTTVDLSGTIQNNLHLTADGTVVGTVTNGTRFTLSHGAIIAGSASLALPSMRPGVTVPVSLRPDVRFDQGSDMLVKIYGQASFRRRWIGCDGGALPYPVGSSGSVYMLGEYPNGHAGCDAPSRPSEASQSARIRNAVSMLPEVRALPLLGQIMFVAWTDAPLASFTVDGETPQSRDLTMIAKPLSAAFPTGPLRLRPGTLTARLVDMVPVKPERWCCFPTVQPVSLGVGGSATFQFDIPDGGHIHFRHLSLSIDSSGVHYWDLSKDGIPNSIGSLFNWHSRQWESVRFHNATASLANRYISPTGTMLVRLQATEATGDITLLDVAHDLQLSGTAVVE